ncbi:MAG: M56 family metallopeptidase, partial [Clostridia bacterium]|nr:M56 family metallopeptidase [Clostridia bacterium]
MSKLFLHLLNISITAGWIVLVVVLLRFVLKKAPKWIRVVLWGLVALRLMLPVSIESVTSLVPSAETVHVEPVTYTIIRDSDPHPLPVEGEQIVLQSGFSALNSVVNPVMEQATAKHVDTVTMLKTVAGWVWLAGVCGMLLYALISFLRLRHRVRASVLLEKGVYVCDEISDPFILGLIVPKIYLPSGMDEQTRAYVLSHERAHLKRYDFIWKPLGFFLLSVYWFNPLLWLAYLLLCRDIELACDEKVVKELDNAGKAAYSEALVHASVSRRMVSACPLAFGETGVKGRVKSVLNYKKPAFWIILVAILACIAVAVCFLTMPKKDKTAEEAALPTAVPETVWGSDTKVVQWFDYYNDFEGFSWDSTKEITVAAFPGVTFRWMAGVEAIENGSTRTLFQGMPVWNVFFADVTGDDKPELCATVSFGSGMIDDHIVVYDYENRQSYTLWERGTFDYHLYMNNGALYVGKTPYDGDKQFDYGTLTMQDGLLCCRWSDGSVTVLNRELHESELF